MIIISGLPSSGNRLVQALIKRGAGGEKVILWHGDNVSPWRKAPPERAVIVIPVRSEWHRRESLRKRYARGDGRIPEDVQRMRLNVAAFISRWNPLVLQVPYEGLVQDPDVVGRQLFEDLGFEWTPWPSSSAKAGADPWDGPVFDANAAHRRTS